MENTPLPKPGSAARYVVDQWAAKGRMAWSDLEGIYMFRLRLKNPRKQRQYATMNLSEILHKYGFKNGPSGSKADWIFGPRTVDALYPQPATVVAKPLKPLVPEGPLMHVFGVGDIVTCNRIGRSVLAEVKSKTADGYLRIMWPNGLFDNVPGGLLQLVSPAEKPRDDMQYGGGDCCNDPICSVEAPVYKSEKTERIEKMLDESRQQDLILAWAKAEAIHLKKIHSTEKICALVEALEEPQFVDSSDEENYDD